MVAGLSMDERFMHGFNSLGGLESCFLAIFKADGQAVAKKAWEARPCEVDANYFCACSIMQYTHLKYLL